MNDATTHDRSWLSHGRYPLVLLGLLVVLQIALAIDPHDRADWLLENGLLFAGVAVLVGTHGKLPLSRVSYTLRRVAVTNRVSAGRCG